MPCYKEDYKTATIYGLADPRNGELRYVGQTIQKLKHRLGGHTSHCFYGEISDEKYQWLMQLKADGVKPEIFEIETVPFQQRDKDELFWIGYFLGLGCRLINIKTTQSKRSMLLRKF